MYSLKQAGVGCFIGSNFVGALAYADDLVLVAPSPAALRRMLLICDAYASEYNILFNAKKSKCIAVLPSTRQYLMPTVKECVFCIGGCSIEIVDSWLHLGHTFNWRLDDAEDINRKRNSMVGQINAVLCYFGSLDPIVKNKLFKAYCSSMYGCEIWFIEHEMIRHFCIAWRKGQRRVWGLPNNTHSDLLPIICNCLPVFDEICRRSILFIERCLSHESELIKFIMRHGILFARTRSMIGSNVIFCSKRFNFRISDLMDGMVNSAVFTSVWRNGVSDNIINTSMFLLEAIALRSGSFALGGNEPFTKQEINAIIGHLAAS